ncbi:MAG: AAA family ATPase [Chitinophagales bacterium]
MPNSLYIAATNQSIGKTTTTLGLLTTLRKRGIDVGYCKPMGQIFVNHNGCKVDKDAALFADILGFELDPSLHSPFIMEKGDSSSYIQSPFYEIIAQKIDYASSKLEAQHQCVVYEGTGHPGVGSVFDFSNADVAQRLGTSVILIVEGGIGYTIDYITLCKNLFESKGVPIAGVIVNKVFPEKMEKVQESLQCYLEKQKIELLGLVPFAKDLAYPMLSTIATEIQGKVLCAEDYMHELVQDIIAGSLIDLDDLNTDHNYLLVVSTQRLTAALTKLQDIWSYKNIPPDLTGVVVTGSTLVSADNLYFLNRHNIPVIQTHFDTYESVIKINKLDVKLNTKSPQKIKHAIELYEQHVNIDRICTFLGV